MKRLVAFLLIEVCWMAGHAAAPKTQPARLVIVDAVAGTPIAGAVAVYHADVWEGTFTGHGGKHADLFRVRATSNAQGEVVFAPTEVNDVRFGLLGLNTNYGGPVVDIRAAGFQAFNLVGHIFSKNLGEAIKWDFADGAVIKLQPLPAPPPRQP